MQTSDSDVRWGQSMTVAEPSAGNPVSVGMLSITSEMVGRQTVQLGGVPSVRDWTIYMEAVGLEPSRLAAPRVTATVRYGSGASSFTRELSIPALGAALHIVASWIDVTFKVEESGLLPNGNLQLSAYASPGRPFRGRTTRTIGNALYVPGTIIAIPPFATSVLSYATPAGATVPLAFRWQYNAIARGVPTLPPLTSLGQWDTARAIPQDVTGVVLLPDPADLFLTLGFEVDG